MKQKIYLNDPTTPSLMMEKDWENPRLPIEVQGYNGFNNDLQ